MVKVGVTGCYCIELVSSLYVNWYTGALLWLHIVMISALKLQFYDYLNAWSLSFYNIMQKYWFMTTSDLSLLLYNYRNFLYNDLACQGLHRLNVKCITCPLFPPPGYFFQPFKNCWNYAEAGLIWHFGYKLSGWPKLGRIWDIIPQFWLDFRNEYLGPCVAEGLTLIFWCQLMVWPLVHFQISKKLRVFRMG